MYNEIDHDRRRLVGAAAMTFVASQFAFSSTAEAQPSKARPANLGAVKPGTHTSFAPLKQIDAGVLNMATPKPAPRMVRPSFSCTDGPTTSTALSTSHPCSRPKATVSSFHICAAMARPASSRMQRSRNGQPSAIAADIIALMDALKIEKATVAGFDWGARTADIMAALWPQRCQALVSVSGYLIGSQEAGKKPLPPKAELQWWYQFYFATERGRAGYEMYRREFSKLIWQLASPKWNFDDATFERSAKAFDNPDHVAIVIHNYRWRQGLAEGETKYDALEKQLAQGPVINVPTITMEGDANGAPHPEPAAYAKMFSGKYSHRTIKGGIGHNLPQEAPRAFAEAIIDVVADS